MHTKFKFCTSFILVFCLIQTLHAQYFEVGLQVGGSNYLGDLSNNSSTVYLQETRAAASIFGRYQIGRPIALRAGFHWAMIGGQDSNSKDALVYNRNLSFRTQLQEFSLLLEWNIPGIDPLTLTTPWSAYLFVGLAGTHFNPQAQLDGVWYDLQPLGTEGQGLANYPERKPYARFAVALPFGIGVKYALNDKWTLSMEVGARKAFTDYLDDVSTTFVETIPLAQARGAIAASLSNRALIEHPAYQPGAARGDSAVTDWYFAATLGIAYRFMDNGLRGARKRPVRRRAGCYD